MDDSTPYALPVDSDVPVAPAVVVNDLQVAGFDVGVSRVFVELVGDGLATGIRVPILVARGRHPGPVFGLTAGIHGNELNGIPVIQSLFRELDPETLRGTVVGVVSLNVPGLQLNRREFIDGQDLNRIMPGRPDGSVSEVYAHRILTRIIHDFEYLVDLHTASFGRVNSLYVRADMDDPRTAAIAYLQDPQIIVHSPGADRTLRGAAAARGIPAITVEIGDPQRWQAGYTRSALAGVRAVLAWAGLIDDGGERETGTPPTLCEASAWMYADRGGLLEVFPRLMDRVAEGDEIAVVRNAFGDPIRRYRAPHDGIVVGKSTNPVGFTGARIVHLGRVASAGRFPPP